MVDRIPLANKILPELYLDLPRFSEIDHSIFKWSEAILARIHCDLYRFLVLFAEEILRVLDSGGLVSLVSPSHIMKYRVFRS